MKRKLIIVMFCMLWTADASADTLLPFQVVYEASYSGLSATAERSLTLVDEAQYRMASTVELKLVGKTLTSINEFSLFNWQGEHLKTLQYDYRQTGIGSRSRRVAFNWDESIALADYDGEVTALPLQGRVFDELSAFVELKRQLAAGATEINFQAVDGNTVEVETYRVVKEERLETPLGAFNSIKLEKVRAPDSTRHTEIWLARDWDYLLIKLFQRDSAGRELELEVTSAVLDEKPLSPLAL